MPDLFVWAQTGAAILTALAAVGAFAYVRSGIRTLNEHDRVLYGEDAVDGWDGIVPMVQRNHKRSTTNEEKVEALKRSCDPDR